MLLTLAIILVLIAVLGGIAVHPLIFALAILALLVFVSDRRGRTV
jgi:hypothetical protein